MKFGIVDRRSGTVIETIECVDMKAFRTHWTNKRYSLDYSFTILDAPLVPFQQRVIKQSENGDNTEFLLFDDTLCAKISAFNGYMTPNEVHYALMQGKTIYTNFSRYRLE